VLRTDPFFERRRPVTFLVVPFVPLLGRPLLEGRTFKDADLTSLVEPWRGTAIPLFRLSGLGPLPGRTGAALGLVFLGSVPAELFLVSAVFFILEELLPEDAVALMLDLEPDFFSKEDEEAVWSSFDNLDREVERFNDFEGTAPGFSF